jgi:hypothetical protein
VGGHHRHVELVDLTELGGLGLGRPRHAGEFLYMRKKFWK